jgi:inosine-uridine nucleoside N-ribohydrolase
MKIVGYKQSRRSFLRTALLSSGFLASPMHNFAFRDKDRAQPTRLIIDADTANEVDDAFAIARALLEPNFKIEGITSAQWHTQDRAPNDTVGLSQMMNEEILSLMKKTNIPHPMGSNIPLVNQQRPQVSDAAELIIQKAHESQKNEKLTIVTLGPNTNVASAVLMDPTIIPKLKCCYLGLWHNPAENTWNKREFNTNNDPNALDLLLNTKELEFEVMTASTSKALVFDKQAVDRAFKGKGGIRDYLVNRWENYDRFWQKSDPEKRQWTMWDVAIIEALANPQLATKRKFLTPHDNLKREIMAYTSIDAEAMRAAYWRAFTAAE